MPLTVMLLEMTLTPSMLSVWSVRVKALGVLSVEGLEGVGVPEPLLPPPQALRAKRVLNIRVVIWRRLLDLCGFMLLVP